MVENIQNNKEQLKQNNSNFIGCLFLILSPFILFFILLSFVAVPAFMKISKNAISSMIKNVLNNGVRTCLNRDNRNLTTNFSDVPLFLESYSGFKIEALDQNSCFKAKALPEDKKDTWFEINLNPKTGEIIKTCGDSIKPGCEKGNYW